MSTFNLLDAAKSYFNNDLISKASASLNETESGVTKAVNAIIPAVISGLADKASTSSGAAVVAKLANEQHESGIAESLSGFFHNATKNELTGASNGLISSIFGTTGQSNILTSLISGFSGIKNSSAGTLLNMALPLVLGLLGRNAQQNNVSSTGISSWLENQKRNALNALPAGFSMSSLSGNAPKITANMRNAGNTHVNEKSGSSMWKWLLPLLLLCLLGLAAYWLLGNGCNGDKKSGDNVTIVNNAGTDTINVSMLKGVVDTVSGDFIYNEGDTITLALPNNGGDLRVGKNSTEARLISFLNDKDAVIDTVKGNWFEFTNVHFKTGSSDLTDVSATQLKNIVAIAKSYPDAKFKFGGYTDSTGNDLLNMNISQKRAEAVSALVNKLGAPAGSILEAKGYGEEFPIADNGTTEGKAMNRRVAINVKAK
jgi:outer membrane protein OmpA-like peptidoglycan-associated protein